MNIRERANEIADRLRGSCDTMSEDEDHDVMTVDGLAEEFDDILWLCEECGWWEDTCDTEDGVCNDCRSLNEPLQTPLKEDNVPAMKKNRRPYYFAVGFAAALITLIAVRGDAAEAIVAGAFALIGTALAALSATGGVI